MGDAEVHGHATGAAHHGSIWPLIIAAAGGFGFGGLAAESLPLIGAGIGFLILGVGGWLWQDAKGISFAVEMEAQDAPYGDVSVRKLGMWLFIVSEVFFFTALISMGLALRVRAAYWPDPGAPDFPLNIPLTGINTFILITSSLTMVEALHAAQQDKRQQMKAFLLATLILGVIFVSIQLIEYDALIFHEHLTPWENPIRPELGAFGTAFFAQTGFHGAHVTGGLLGLAFLTAMAFKGKYGKDDHEAIELVGLYWHFVDIVWIFLFPIMYLIGR